MVAIYKGEMYYDGKSVATYFLTFAVVVVGFSADSLDLVIEEGESFCYCVQVLQGLLSGNISIVVQSEDIDTTGKARAMNYIVSGP